jgi:hypothetical protein
VVDVGAVEDAGRGQQGEERKEATRAAFGLGAGLCQKPRFVVSFTLKATKWIIHLSDRETAVMATVIPAKGEPSKEPSKDSVASSTPAVSMGGIQTFLAFVFLMTCAGSSNDIKWVTTELFQAPD